MGFWDLGAGDLLSAGASVAGGIIGDKGADRRNRQNIALQKEFAQHGIRWKVEDAKKAGLHPLYALGGSVSTYSPTISAMGDNAGLGRGIAEAGQNLGRAIESTRTADERTKARMDALALRRGELQNQMLEAQIANLTKSAQVGPALPSATPGLTNLEGQGDVHPIKVVPHEVLTVNPDQPSSAPGVQPETIWTKTSDGGFRSTANKEVYEEIDFTNPEGYPWVIKEKIAPNLWMGNPPPDSYLPNWASGWVWSYTDQSWFPSRRPNPWEKLRNYVPRRTSARKGRMGYANEKVPVSPPQAGGW